jgi:hypothetical protein
MRPDEIIAVLRAVIGRQQQRLASLRGARQAADHSLWRGAALKLLSSGLQQPFVGQLSSVVPDYSCCAQIASFCSSSLPLSQKRSDLRIAETAALIKRMIGIERVSVAQSEQHAKNRPLDSGVAVLVRWRGGTNCVSRYGHA